jgi:antitoxin ParD1/3/4
MNVNLTPELEALVRSKVESGLYGSASEVVREALRLLEAQDRTVKLRELRRDIEDGLASGPAGDLDVADIKRRGRVRLKKSRKI